MKNFFYLFIIFFILAACQSTKDALTLKKKSSSDEFLVEKKSPLVLPPKYGELPLPDENMIKEKKDGNNDIKITLGGEKIDIEEPIKNSKPTSLEKSVLEKIK
tara:strand:+ start:2884 stop:3192 length:309 start_codon:yes stop_codon:yes gene_type:complete